MVEAHAENNVKIADTESKHKEEEISPEELKELGL